MTAQNSTKRGSNAKRKRGARQKAMQALYQWDFDQAANEPEQVIQQFCDMQNMDKVDVEYFESLFNDAVENIEQIDTEISRHLDRELSQLDPIERSVLRICCSELKSQLGTPYKVVVNEALEISKDFGADKGYRYINGIADKLAASLRAIEYNANHPSGNPLSDKPSVRQSAHKAPGNNVKVSMKEKSPETPQKASQKSPQKAHEKAREKIPATTNNVTAPKASDPKASEQDATGKGATEEGAADARPDSKVSIASSTKVELSDADQSTVVSTKADHSDSGQSGK